MATIGIGHDTPFTRTTDAPAGRTDATPAGAARTGDGCLTAELVAHFEDGEPRLRAAAVRQHAHRVTSRAATIAGLREEAAPGTLPGLLAWRKTRALRRARRLTERAEIVLGRALGGGAA